MRLFFVAPLLCCCIGVKVQNCENLNEVQTTKGETVNLVSGFGANKSCIFVFSHQDGSHQCCYGSQCKKLERCRGGTSEVIVSVEQDSCSLTIKRVDFEHAGTYKTFDREAKPIKECKLMVEEVSKKWKIIRTILFVIAGLALCGTLLLVILYFMYKRRSSPWMGIALIPLMIIVVVAFSLILILTIVIINIAIIHK